MFTAEIKNQLPADYHFGSNSFKWVYYAAVKFARHCIHKHDFIDCIVIRFDNDIRVAVDRSGLTIDTNTRTIDIEKEGK